jgi:60 kDa SS-A/Ro ribonucleoprotein
MLFNFKAKQKNVVTNYEGAKAFSMTPEMELYTAVVTSTLSDKFYEGGAERVVRIRTLIQKCDALFVAQLAVYAREKMHLRSMPLVLAIELAKVYNGDDLVSRLINRIIQRADELTETLAYYELANGRTGQTKGLNKLSKQVQRGVANAFNKFDEYQFGKYNRDGAIKLKDALFIAHPKAKDAIQQAIFDKIVKDELATPFTWETELSALGQVKYQNEAEKAQAFTAKWEALIDSNKVGYMALMRNLRNILEANVSATHIEKVCATLADANQVAKSKQLPFRFLAAYRELKDINSGYTPSILAALEDAVVASIANMRGFGFDTSIVIACDVSGSMQIPISAKSKVLNYDIGLMLGMMLQSKCKNVESGMFGDRWKVINMPNRSILQNVQEYYRREGEVGYSTNGYLVIEDLLKRQKAVDKVMIFTDVQMWDSSVNNNNNIANSWLKYRQTVAPNAKLYLFDLAGHGNTPLDLSQGNDVHLIAGWSDKIFDILAAIEEGGDAVKVIRAIEI